MSILRSAWIAPAVLIAVGCLQMVGDLTDLRAIKAIGAATGASPAPKVFTAHKGFETYSSQFFVRWTDKASGEHKELRLTPAIYRGVRGPYNRRNAYGAILSYAPVLQSEPATRQMHDGAIAYSICGESSLLEEIGIDRATIAGPVTIELKPRQQLPAHHGWKLIYGMTCDAE
jgi:hypothetical protein